MNNYLVAAYVVLWTLHAGYLWSLGSRQKKMLAEIESLEERVKKA